MDIMSVSSMAILLIAIVIYFFLPRKVKPYYLLLISLGFYVQHTPKNIIFLIITSLTVYFGARYFNRLDEKSKLAIQSSPENRKEINAEKNRKKKTVLVAIILLNLASLVYFKYTNWIINIFNKIFAMKQFNAIELILPLGISFYTFQAIGYLIDVYRGKYSAEKSYFNIFLFLSYFPQVIQGPIGRYDTLMPQLLEDNKFDYNRTVSALFLILWGYFKKLVIAEGLAPLVNEILANYETYQGFYIFIAIFLYSIQIYGDFSGGIDIISGISEIMGIQLDRNFNRPFFSRSLDEFWRRWHMTLGSWMRDYVFYSIAFSPKFAKITRRLRKSENKRLAKLLPSAVASFIVFFCVGIWHGSSFKYIAFGVYNGTIITASLLLEPYYEIWKTKLNIDSNRFGWKFFQIIRTLFLCTIGRYFTRGTSFRNAIALLKNTFIKFNPYILLDGSLSKINITNRQISLLLISIFVLFLVEIVEEKNRDVRFSLMDSHVVFRSVVMACLLFFILLFGVYGPTVDTTVFIYQGF
jgi:alginate O-acetyltransferase complex protein AlgI